ncbi:MAG: cation diffusion facilitator family transporter [Clostridiaceae bacterium]|nr:cation diffusion facilitator family transporter [Clostridiaceae bacterium]
MKNVNYKKVAAILWIILFANFSVAILKIIIGYRIKSTGLTADGFHSLTDGSSNIIGLIGIKFASKPVDDDHPYGHQKFETLASLFIAIMLFILGVKIIIEAVFNIIHPQMPQITLESLIILIFTLCINVFITKYEFAQGKKLNSSILIADSLHTKSDVIVSIGILSTLIAIKLGLSPVFDSISSLIVSVFILHASFEIFRDNCGVLMDKAVIDSSKVKEIVMNFNEVKDVHKIRSRGRENDIYLDLHIMVEPDIRVQDSHTLAHQIEDRLCKEFNKNMYIIIHVEPFSNIITKEA